ncbi:hypothetical protein ABC304_02220 [Microbacterium sp. 1P10UB]|uniref:hypothetical protein n=1 Tax=unclassified Microbacterium TaxID=2609290 RepID=UPI00399F9C57
MTDDLAVPSKGRQFLLALISALAAAVGYLVAELLMQHDTSSVLLGMIGITVVLTPLFYLINLRRSRPVRRR